MISDLRLAFRHLVKSPGFTFVAVLTLALGIGANTAIFSVINAAFLRPLRYSEPDQLVELWTSAPDGTRIPTITGPQYKQLRDHAKSFTATAIYYRFPQNLIDRGKAERVGGLEATPSFLSSLRLDPLHGRLFDPSEDQLGRPPVVVLTYDWWRTRFGGDPTIVGQVISLNEVSRTVVGVLPPNALALDDVGFILPLALEDGAWKMNPDNAWARTLYRLKPGVTPQQAQEEVRALAAELHRRLTPQQPQGVSIEVRPLQDVLTETSRPTLLMLFGAVGLVLLIACANVANLLLARAQTRQKEMAVRMALGASESRIIRQILTESVLLSLLGGILGIGLAVFAVDILGRAVVGVLPAIMQPQIDLPVLIFSIILACGTGVVFGLFPALRARRTDLNHDLKDVGRGSTSGSRTRTQSLLIISEVALTATLLIGAGLLLLSFSRVLAADPGFNPHNALVAEVAISAASFENQESVAEFGRELVRRVEALPGVDAAGTSSTLPMSGESWGGRIRLSAKPENEQDQRGTGLDYVGGDYFGAMGITLMKGRLIAEADDQQNSPKVAVINQRLAQDLFPTSDPIGQYIRVVDLDWEIVGVVRSIRHGTLDTPATPRVYLPHVHQPYVLRLIVRTHVPPMAIVDNLRQTITALSPNQSLSKVRTLEETVNGALQERRVALVLLGIFAAVALSLAALGIYGVMAYTIGQRLQELSIRMALGADRNDVLRLVLRDGMRLSLIGIVAGLLAGVGGSKLIASRLYEVGAVDPLVFSAVGIVVTLVAFLSVYIPARRASRTDPLQALRAG